MRPTARAARSAALAGLLALAAGVAAAGAEEDSFSLGGAISQRSYAAGGLSAGAAWSYGGSS
ncbi:MAG: hypothetical protein JNG85_01445, partial [Spirochaetaceae bacterium]|nr:hypothetical protein [Spirochaetaceae bacterium]